MTTKKPFVFFDAVGTLIYPTPPVYEIYQKTGKQFGISLSYETVTERFLNAYEQHFKNNNKLSDEKLEKQRWESVVNDVFSHKKCDIKNLFSTLWQHFSEPTSWAVYEDTNKLLTHLYEKGIQVGIASNFDQRLLKICDEFFPFIEKKYIFYSSEIGYSKPDINFFKHINEKFNHEKYNFTLIGDDMENDIKAAKKVGWLAIHRNDADMLYKKLDL